MFNGIKLRTLLSTPQEWHAFVIGFFEVLCPWPSRCYIPKEQRDQVLAEYHYYSAGRGAGFSDPRSNMTLADRFHDWVEGLSNAWKDRLRGWLLTILFSYKFTRTQGED